MVNSSVLRIARASASTSPGVSSFRAQRCNRRGSPSQRSTASGVSTGHHWLKNVLNAGVSVTRSPNASRSP